jgi:signal transduction histidine kinase
VIVGLIPLSIAVVGAVYAALILRGTRTRDNIAFGILALTDAAMTAWRGLNVLAGGSIISRGVLVPCTIGTIALALLTIEFIAAFPGRRPMSWRWRGPLLAWAVVGVIAAALDSRNDWGTRLLSELVFFVPATIVVFIIGARSFVRTERRDAKIVIGMLWFRWAFGLFAYFVGPQIGLFEELVWAEATFGALIGFVVVGTVVLKTELFTTRSSAFEVITIATIALVILLSGGAALWGALSIDPGRFQLLALFGATLVPLVLASIGWRLYPRLEHRVLAGFDERRAKRLGVQGEPIPADATAAIAEATRRISAISDGAAVRFELAAALDAALVESLRDGQPQRKCPMHGAAGSELVKVTASLPAWFIVPALGAHGAVVGAFLIEDGLIDRDTYLVARDLAARVALVVERDSAVSELEDARRLAALGQFAAAIAHDIRTPLTSISLNVQILRRKLQLPDDDREHLDIALEELDRLDKNVAEILEFAKPVKIALQPIDVGELIETTARGMSPVLSEKQIALRCEPPSALVVHGDAARLRQVLVNLVDNAADASKPGAEVTVRAAAEGESVAIEIEDHGRGIGAADLPRIFEPFFTTRPDGTGLGLAICHKVVRAHGGELKVRSSEGIGSIFTILLPAA